MARLKPLSGFPEFLPQGQMVENHVTHILEQTFELHGFAPIHTRAVETMESLTRKGEIDKEVYVVNRLHAEPGEKPNPCLLYTSPSPRDGLLSRMPSSA